MGVWMITSTYAVQVRTCGEVELWYAHAIKTGSIAFHATLSNNVISRLKHGTCVGLALYLRCTSSMCRRFFCRLFATLFQYAAWNQPYIITADLTGIIAVICAADQRPALYS